MSLLWVGARPVEAPARADGFLINRTGLLDFIDPMLREAVQKVFLQHKSIEKEARKKLARYLTEVTPGGGPTAPRPRPLVHILLA